ncbi:SsrA-binding protein [Candidatus Falkowbacteria bacterium RIFCSPLOWO2_12_FULL_45_13]|uniref:SsrA-binding protein n=2 Tax=Candidatus Falkowiibacteriota TaxID=1752728 RepID=A0A1F5SBW9_9BACT|nr:MAG: SsrA-binding protein [Candidatus Falkowbacteria bacterium RIFCSPLOWO2_02_FULL_45_21]OGF30345.1 MAG: SsrA-binding protein [Candidatus Falkowbacteria bacterium RIFCSPLOWO2_12_FULL_45_13]
MPVLAVNKRANFDYDIQEIYEAGLVLLGYEVKSIKTGHVSLKGSYVTFKKSRGKNLPEAYLTNAHIPLYKFAGDWPGYEPLRARKLLLKKKEIRYLMGKKDEQGLTLIPIKIYTKHSFIKLEFGVGKGRKKYDKREVIKKRELDREVRTLTKGQLRITN